MFGMLLVNFLGGYKVCPQILKHTNDYCSYADTIMPQFFFAAGFAMRLSLGKRLQGGGKMPWGRAIRRILGLALVAIAWYSFCDLSDIITHFRTQRWDNVLFVLFKGQLFQTLLHIAATSLWILPVITLSWKARLGYTVASGILHLLISWWFNYDWVYGEPGGIDGGPLGFMSWAIPTLCGTLACDAVRASGIGAGWRITLCGAALMILGWGLSIGTTLYDVPADQMAEEEAAAAATPESKPTPDPAAPIRTAKPDPRKFAADPVIPAWERLRSWDGKIVEPPFVRPPDHKHRKWNYWMMSQRGCTISYTIFSGGLSLVVYALFLWACDAMNWRLGIFRTLGTNSLAAYILSDIGSWIVSPYFPRDSSSAIMALVGFACLTLIVYGCCRLLERMGWYIRV